MINMLPIAPPALFHIHSSRSRKSVLTLVFGYRSAIRSITSCTNAEVSLVLLEASWIASEVVTMSANPAGSKW